MLKPRLPPAPPPPQSRVRIGAYMVDLSAREVTDEATGTRTRITGKAQAVIAELAVSPGQVLSRDELLDRVWTGAFPTGDVLTQAITSLRRAFGDDAEAPRYIETISKSGYRLIAPVQWLPAQPRVAMAAPSAIEADAPLAPAAVAPAFVPAPMASSTPMSRRRLVWAAGITIVLAIAAAAFFSRSPPAPAGTGMDTGGGRREMPLVIVAGAGDEWGPRLSPDASTVVFSSTPLGDTTQLMLQSAMVATPTPLTHPAAGERDLIPTWSPDGRSIVFQRHSDAAACKLMLVAATGGTPRQLGLCPSNIVLLYDWSPDGRRLVMGGTYDERGSGGFPIQSFDIASGEWTRLDYPSSPGDLDLEPRYSPDGQWLVFRRNISAADLWRMPAAGGTPERLTRITTDIRGFDWAPDGRHIVFSSVDQSGLALFSLDVETLAITPLGIESATFPDFPRSGDELVFEMQRGQLGLAHVALGDDERSARRILASSGNELNAESAPDGSAVAFYSDRSGKTSVWVAPLGSEPGAPQPVENFTPMARFNPTWSPDSRRFLVIGFGSGGAGLYEIDRASLRVQALEVGFGAPRFADYIDADTLIVGSIDGERQSLWIADRRGNALQPRGQRLDGVTYARVDPSRERIFLARIGQRGLWVTDHRLSPATHLFSSTPDIIGYKLWTVSGRDLVVARADPSIEGYRVEVWPLDRIEGEPRATRTLPGMDVVTLGLLGDGGLVLTESFGNGRDIGLIHYRAQVSDP